MTYIKETTILVPKPVELKAKDLASKGFYEQALELLNDNKVEFDIYTDSKQEGFIKANISSKLTNLSGFQSKIKEERIKRWKGARK